MTRIATGRSTIKRPNPRTWAAQLWYHFVRAVLFACFVLGSSLRITGGANLRRKGALLVIANHQSYLDPPLIGVASPRQLCFLARKTLFRHPLFAWLIGSLNSAPVDQEGIGIEGLRIVMQLLAEGEAVVVFPEGERSPDGSFSPLKPGILMLVRKMKVPIVPVGIAGAYDTWPRWRLLPGLSPLFLPPTNQTLGVAIGKPIDTARLTAMPRDEALAELLVIMHQMYAEAERIRRK